MTHTFSSFFDDESPTREVSSNFLALALSCTSALSRIDDSLSSSLLSVALSTVRLRLRRKNLLFLFLLFPFDLSGNRTQKKIKKIFYCLTDLLRLS